MKFGIALAIIVHYTVHSIWSVVQALYRTWALILFFKLNKIIIRRLKSEIKNIKTYNPYEIW